MTACLLCGNEFPAAEKDRYNRCPKCGSHIYVCDSRSSELNRTFYDEVFDGLRDYRVDRIKKNVFYLFKSVDKALRRREYARFDSGHAEVPRLLRDRTKKVLEVGFGTGEALAGMLKAGTDAYGIDISRANVDRFVGRHPEYAGRVECATRFGGKVDIVYSSALFEHLDDPRRFLEDADSAVTDGGHIILDNIPVAGAGEANIPPGSDINFWDGIHKAVYSRDALVDFFSRSGYELRSFGEFDYFIYRVLSAHKHYGYRAIERVRHPYMSGDGLPNLPGYARACCRALTIRSVAMLGFAVFRKAGRGEVIPRKPGP